MKNAKRFLKKKHRKKKSRLENEEDDDLEIVIDKFVDEEDFISFEDDENARNARHENLHENHAIENEFLLEIFFDDV
jgi:hypothetical protein